MKGRIMALSLFTLLTLMGTGTAFSGSTITQDVYPSGTVTINGQPAPDNTSITAEVSCTRSPFIPSFTGTGHLQNGNIGAYATINPPVVTCQATDKPFGAVIVNGLKNCEYIGIRPVTGWPNGPVPGYSVGDIKCDTVANNVQFHGSVTLNGCPSLDMDIDFQNTSNDLLYSGHIVKPDGYYNFGYNLTPGTYYISAFDIHKSLGMQTLQIATGQTFVNIPTFIALGCGK